MQNKTKNSESQNFHFILSRFNPIVNFAVQKSGSQLAIFETDNCYLTFPDYFSHC